MKEPKGEGTYNVIVIGAGTAGLGGRVALIERHKMGGDCLNFGCVPSKALISSSRLIRRIQDAEHWGLDKQEPQFQFEKVFERMRSRRAKIEPNDSQERFESLGVDVFRGEARFLSTPEIEVDGQKLRARNFVIAAGSRAGLPKIDGLGEVPYFTNETVFDNLRSKPESLIVLGGGPIGCELGQVMSRLGVRVTIVQHRAQILAKEDPDVAEFMRKRFEAEGIRVMLNANPGRARLVEGRAQLELKGGEKLVADAVLVAAGRIPNVEKLNLEAAGVRYNPRGVEVNEYMQTSQPPIYAAGDIAATIHAYPTFAELARKAGDKFNKTRQTATGKKLVTWLYIRARATR